MSLSIEIPLLLFKLYILYEIISYEFFRSRKLKIISNSKYQINKDDEESKIIIYSYNRDYDDDEKLHLQQQEQDQDQQQQEEVMEEDESIDLRECIFLLICVGLIIFDWTVYCLNNQFASKLPDISTVTSYVDIVVGESS